MQVESVKRPSSFPFAPVGKAVAATVIMGMVVAIVPLVQVVLLPFLALPFAYVSARWGFAKGAAVAAVSTALVYFGAGTAAALLVLLLVLGVGIVLGVAVQRGWRFGRSLALTAGGAFLALILWGVFMWLALGASLTWLRETVDRSIDGAAARYMELGMSADTVETTGERMRALIDIVPYLTPGLLGMLSVLLGVCSLGLAYLLFPRMRERIATRYSLSGFKMHWATAYASIVGLALLLFASRDEAWSDVVMYVGINILLVSQTLFFVQGMAVARWFVIERKMSRGARTALYAAGILGQVIAQFTGLVGLLDTWVDYRKRFALKGPGAGSAR
ncbi:MAG: DUF2232 domain-containing protein [Thermoleophilia bacterium]|nr:DUF2232 domain-containing protein [Thermoleophilia bacterium]